MCEPHHRHDKHQIYVVAASYAIKVSFEQESCQQLAQQFLLQTILS